MDGIGRTRDFLINAVYSVLMIFWVFLLIQSFRVWGTWIVYTKCNMQSYRTYLERTTKMRDVAACISLLNTYMSLGYYDKYPQLMNRLNEMHGQWTKKQSIKIEIIKMQYLSQAGMLSLLKEEKNEMLNLIADLKHDNENYQNAMLQIYNAEKNYEKIIEVLNKSKPSTVYGDVEVSLSKGFCYYKLKLYKQAYENCCFACKWGGNTIYVNNAQSIIDNLPDEVKKSEVIYKLPHNYRVAKCRLLMYILLLGIVSGAMLLIHHGLY